LKIVLDSENPDKDHPNNGYLSPLFSKLVLVIKERLFYNKIAALVLPPKIRGKELFRIVSTQKTNPPRSPPSFFFASSPALVADAMAIFA